MRSIYDERAFFSATPGDRPDFVLQSNPASQCFGVEVTEVHASGPNARLTHMPSYALHLIDGGEVRHKEDSRLKIDRVEFTSPDGTKQPGRAVMLDPPNLADYKANLARAITRKAAKAGGYRPGLSHLNLVVLDHAQPFVLAGTEVANLVITDESVRGAVLSPEFNEIYVVTRLSPEPERQVKAVYLPLRQLLLASSVFLFRGAVKEFAPRGCLKSWSRLAPALCDYLGLVGLPSRLHEPAVGLELLVGTIGLRIAEDRQIHVHDYTNWPVTPALDMPVDPTAPWRHSDFEAAFLAYRKENFVELSHVFPVRADWRGAVAAV